MHVIWKTKTVLISQLSAERGLHLARGNGQLATCDLQLATCNPSLVSLAVAIAIMQLGLTKEGRHCCCCWCFWCCSCSGLLAFGSCLHFGLFAATTHVAGVLEQQQQQQQHERFLFVCLHWPALLALGAAMLTLNLNLAAFIKPSHLLQQHSPHCNLGAFFNSFLAAN